jgi:hypothetical protein
LEEIDFINPDPAEDYISPPAYGDIYGEIRNEENGLGTSTRVNTRTNQVNRRLSQVFIPAPRQQVQNVEDRRRPPSPYIPSSLGGEKGVPPPPGLEYRHPGRGLARRRVTDEGRDRAGVRTSRSKVSWKRTIRTKARAVPQRQRMRKMKTCRRH